MEDSLEGYTEILVQNLIQNLLCSLNYLHPKKKIHRDIKPENLILRTKDNITDLVIAYFGLSHIYNEQGIYLFQRCGTIGYVAPEVLKNEHYHYKVDMFSVGVILFILLTGEISFQGDGDTNDLLKQNALCQIDFNKLNNRSISLAAQDFVRLLLDENVKIRPNAEQALQHNWFITPKIDSIVSLSLIKLPQINIKLDQNDFIKSSTPLWNQKGSPLSEQSPLQQYLQDDIPEIEDENNYFKQFFPAAQDAYEIIEDCVYEEKSPSQMVPKYSSLLNKEVWIDLQNIIKELKKISQEINITQQLKRGYQYRNTMLKSFRLFHLIHQKSNQKGNYIMIYLQIINQNLYNFLKIHFNQIRIIQSKNIKQYIDKLYQNQQIQQSIKAMKRARKIYNKFILFIENI